ncbi:Acetyltransferase (GNAT) domain-containing protein [Cohnella sp. OV330]|uniref:GNAT family N-acetyltransferase n=1 Tax=Cohnella sp. OV330 TaxID=1855288 RepID=UPI0008E549D0|nr:GNAT family N-acetyltransferase [Cohnella sp. OV330]SFA76595.1 Acetyltransferase (GNAT) domain-containing protein [Cohnella sp. OV330]
MRIIYATESDYDYIKKHDRHLLESLIAQKISQKEIYIFTTDDHVVIGWMRYGYFWDNTPFMNMIWIDEPYRSKGLGRKAVRFWEEDMKQKGFKVVMTSTLSNEEAQHFYRNSGYRDAGCLLLEQEPLEILFSKIL